MRKKITNLNYETFILNLLMILIRISHNCVVTNFWLSFIQQKTISIFIFGFLIDIVLLSVPKSHEMTKLVSKCLVFYCTCFYYSNYTFTYILSTPCKLIYFISLNFMALRFWCLSFMIELTDVMIEFSHLWMFHIDPRMVWSYFFSRLKLFFCTYSCQVS